MTTAVFRAAVVKITIRKLRRQKVKTNTKVATDPQVDVWTIIIITMVTIMSK